MTTLPAGGREGPAPAWPLRDDIALATQARLASEKAERLREQLNDCDDKRSARRLEREVDDALAVASTLEAQLAEVRELELELWDQLWQMPQAVQWERLRWARDVAQYARWKVRAEMGELKAGAEARQLSDRLGLTPLALLRLRWEIEAETGTKSGTTNPPSSRRGKGAARPTSDPRSVLRAV